MSDSKNDGTARLDIERAMLGDNSIGGTVRLLAYIAIFAVIFGSLFSYLLH